ncbi:MAG: DUF4038 domain-containing protein [Clostridiaceae bacterium]|jgi:hypothetical protein|nr:DUF4038 domain-containing protein [Clostridiaceae bacterium]
MRTLQVKGRYLAWDDGTPFFYLGDTAWELFHQLNREEAAYYLKTRASQGFTAIQAVALAEFKGLTTANAYGRLPLQFTQGVPDPETPDLDGDYSYWAHVDDVIQTAQQHDLLITLLPTWGDKFNRSWGDGPEIFNVQNAYVYGKWIAGRYRDQPNIIWMLGGDRPLEAQHRAIIDAMAAGIREADPNHLITFHPPGGRDSTDFLADAAYIDFHASQTGHDVAHCYASDAVMRKMAGRSSKPYLDAEPRYEDHPACFNDRLGYFWNDADIRQNAYWNILAGACGHTYGNHNVWSMNRVPASYFPHSWQESLTHPGAEQIGFVKKLRLSRDYFTLVPAPELVCDTYDGMGHMAAAAGHDYVFFYAPLGVPFTVDLDKLGDAKYYKASWFDPRRGTETVFAILPNAGKTLLAPPSQGKGCDWVLILDAVIK